MPIVAQKASVSLHRHSGQVGEPVLMCTRPHSLPVGLPFSSTRGSSQTSRVGVGWALTMRVSFLGASDFGLLAEQEHH